MRSNQLIVKTPTLLNNEDEDDLVAEGEIFGALWHYRRLKAKLLMTLEWGLRGGRNRPPHLISTMVSWIVNPTFSVCDHWLERLTSFLV